MWRPGTAIQEYDEQYFHLETIKYPKKDLGYISLISVDPNYQGSGIGKKLVEKAIKQQKEWGTKVIIVHVSTSSPGGASEKLFTSFGFVFNYLHKQPWYEYSKREGQEGFSCIFCGNPCTCDELEMVLELLKTDYK